MKYTIPFGRETLSFELEERRVKYVAFPVKPVIPEDPDALIEESLDHPIGTARLEELLDAGMKVLVLIDDITRPTPKKQMLEHVLRRIARSGVKREDVTICVAPGTHRPMTEEEKLTHIGKEILADYRLTNPSYTELDRFTYLGDTPSGIPIDVYQIALESDFILGIGNIVPHVSAGWGGGAKIIQPGICGERTTQGTHVIAALAQNVMETCGNADNQCRREMEWIAEKVGLKFIVNTVMDEEKHLLGVFSGHYIAAHRAGAALARQVLSPEIPCKTDIVIASANPAEADFWQADKPFVFSQYGLKDGGTLIFVMSGDEGLCGNAPSHENAIRTLCTRSEEEIRKLAADGKIADLIAIDNPIHLDQVRKRGVNTLLVSKGLTEQDASALGFTLCRNMEEALQRAGSRQGREATIGVIPYCGETMVHVKEDREKFDEA